MDKLQKALSKAGEGDRAQADRTRAAAVGEGGGRGGWVNGTLSAAARFHEAVGDSLNGTRRRSPPPRPAPRVRPEADETPGAPPEPADASIPVLDIPLERLQAKKVLTTGIEGAAADALRILRTQLLLRLEAGGHRSIAICAPGQGQGKTLIAVNLAAALVRQVNVQVVLVDLDLRRPSVHSYFGLKPKTGVSSYLLGRAPLADCLVCIGSDQLVVLPQSGSTAASSELLASPRMALMMGELRARYPEAIIICDCPPLLATDDPIVTMRYTDCCLLVAHEGRTKKADLLRAAELVGEERLLGTVLNNARWAMASGYYYYYG
jgi:protein-tyrosine kinase